MIVRNEFNGNVALGSRLKGTTVALLDSVQESAEAVADVVTSFRSGVELVHGAMQPIIAEQRVEYAGVVQQGVAKLQLLGMSHEDACKFMQVDLSIVEPKAESKSNLV